MKTAPVSPMAPRILAAFAAIYLIWGSTYLAILFGLQSLPPLLLSGMRFSIAGLILLGWQMLRGERPVLRPTLRHATAGVLMLFCGTGAVVWVEQYIQSGVAATVVATVPFWFVLLDRRNWAANFSNKAIIGGIVLGFAGVMLLFRPHDSLSGSAGMAMLILLTGCVCWAGGSLFARDISSPHSAPLNAGIQMLAAGMVSLLASWGRGELRDFSLHAVSGSAWLGLAYLVVFGSLVGYLAYVWLMGKRPMVQVGTYAYVNPVVALLLGWSFAGETLGWSQLLALATILTGVLLINLPKYRSAKVKPA